MNIAEILKKRREILKISQLDLSQMSGVSLSTVKDLERGHGNPSVATLEALCKVLGLEFKLETKSSF